MKQSMHFHATVNYFYSILSFLIYSFTQNTHTHTYIHTHTHTHTHTHIHTHTHTHTHTLHIGISPQKEYLHKISKMVVISLPVCMYIEDCLFGVSCSLKLEFVSHWNHKCPHKGGVQLWAVSISRGLTVYGKTK